MRVGVHATAHGTSRRLALAAAPRRAGITLESGPMQRPTPSTGVKSVAAALTALESHWNRTGIALESHWNRTGIALESRWNQAQCKDPAPTPAVRASFEARGVRGSLRVLSPPHVQHTLTKTYGNVAVQKNRESWRDPQQEDFAPEPACTIMAPR